MLFSVLNGSLYMLSLHVFLPFADILRCYRTTLKSQLEDKPVYPIGSVLEYTICYAKPNTYRDSNGNRTRAIAVTGQRTNRYTMEPYRVVINYSFKILKIKRTYFSMTL